MAEFKGPLSIPNADKVSRFLSNLSAPPFLPRSSLIQSSEAERVATFRGGMHYAGRILTPEAPRVK